MRLLFVVFLGVRGSTIIHQTIGGISDKLLDAFVDYSDTQEDSKDLERDSFILICIKAF